MIERYATQRILEDLTFFPVVGIVGPRQVGKITLAKMLSKTLEQEVMYLDLELNSDKIRLQESIFVDILAHINANILNSSDLSRSLGISVPTINKYINLLEGSYLIRTLPAFSANVGKRLVKSPKIYIRDSGILHQLMGAQNTEQLLGHPAVGASWESYVIEQIARKITGDWKMYFIELTREQKLTCCLSHPNKNVFW